MNAAFTGLRKRGCSSKCSRERETMTKKREQNQFTKREEKCVPVSQPEKTTGVQLQRENILGIF